MSEQVRTNKWLLPLSWCYGAGVWLRNQLFDRGILHSKGFDLPVISVGNITVGGTGKTPHVEYLIRLLRPYVKVAMLSRGYKRHTKGYVLASAKTTAHDIGDEPYQIKSKYGDIFVAVDADRREGIQRLTTDRQTRGVGVVLLDDAFQHRHVRPGLSILLTDYHRLVTRDMLLPAGRLREPVSGKRRADIVVVTKCPADISRQECQAISRELDLRTHQTLYFSTTVYQRLQPMYCGESLSLEELSGEEHILLISGVAQPAPIVKEIQQHCKQVTHLSFGDHHDFTPADMERLNQTFASLPHPRLAITTEKDGARLTIAEGMSEPLRHHLYLLPIEVRILQDQEATFNQKIINYVRKDTADGILDQRKDDHTS